jgi:hypothetical protein
MIRFTDIHLTPTSKGTLNVQLRVHYDGSRGFPVIASARLLNGWNTLPWASAAPVPITHGSIVGQPVTFNLHFVGADPAAPFGFTSDGVDLALALPDQPPFQHERFDYIRDWTRDYGDTRPADLDRRTFASAPLTAEAIRSAYDWDENGAWLAVQTQAGGRALVIVQPGPALTVLRWTYFPPSTSGAPPVRGGSYTIPAGGRADLATGTLVADDARADLAWEALDAQHSQARPLGAAQLALWRTAVTVPVAATRVFARGNPQVGTCRDWAEVRDLFDNCNEVPYRQNWCVDDIWGAAGIQLRIVLRRDIQVAANWAQQLPASSLHAFSREQNLPRMLNVYFFRQVEGARAWGAPDHDPGQSNQDGALWVGDRCFDADPACWVRDVITVAHETGHFLALGHLCDDTGTVPRCLPGDAQYLMYGAGTGPDSRRLTDVEVYQARQRAWFYRP